VVVFRAAPTAGTGIFLPDRRYPGQL